MTATEFRKLALSLPKAIESAHMHHPDFRVAGKIFATLGYPNKDFGVVKLTRDEQKRFIQDYPDAFKPVKGAWGRRGHTQIYLPAAKIGIVREALRLAWRNTAPKRLFEER